MNTTKKLTIKTYTKIVIPELTVTKITKKKHNYIITGTIPHKQTITIPIDELKSVGIEPYPTELNNNILEIKTFIIPKDNVKLILPPKRKIPKVKKIHLN